MMKALNAARGALGSFASGEGKIASLGGLVGGFGLAATAVMGFKQAIEGAANMETLETAFATMMHSTVRAKELLGELSKFADATPLDMPEIADAGKKLLAFGSNSTQVINELRMLGDIGAGVGSSLGELSELYGKARVQGRLMAEDVNQLTGRGIPIIQEFAKQFSVSTSEVRGLVEAGKIGFPQLRAAMQDMTGEGGRFFEMMKKQSLTATGLWSTFTGGINAVLREFGKPVLMELKASLTDAIAFTSTLVTKASEWGQAVATALAVIREMASQGTLGTAIVSGLQLAAAKLVNFSVKGIVGGIAAAVTGVVELLKGLLNLVFDAGTWKGVFDGLLSVGLKIADAIGAAMREAFPSFLTHEKAVPGIGSTKPQNLVYGFHGLTGEEHKVESAFDKVFDTFKTGFENMGNVLETAPSQDQFMAALMPAWDAVKLAQEAAAAAAKKAGDAEVPNPEPVESGDVGGGAKKSKQESTSDRFQKLGLFVGAGGPAGERYARDTAAATQKSARHLETIANNTKPIPMMGASF